MNESALSARQKRMHDVVTYLQDYMRAYTNQRYYFDYSDETFIDDVLYGLGVALNPEYQYGEGFDKFKARLRKHLEDK